MTLLQKNDIADIADGLAEYDLSLQQRVGCGLRELALRAAGGPSDRPGTGSFTARVGVIPMTCGRGRIPGFSEALEAISEHLGFAAFVTRSTDASGLAEAVECGAEIILLADDARFTAVHLGRRRVVDNARATGRGFATGLALMAGGLARRAVLVIGCGPVGKAAAHALLQMEAEVTLFDIDPRVARHAAAELGIARGKHVSMADDLRPALRENRLLFDATPAAAFIDRGDITEDTVVAAPGMPLGVTREAAARLGLRLLHDPLQIGTATMLMEAALNAA